MTRSSPRPDESIWLNSVHNYFFAKTLDKLRPGGVMAYITSHYTMDAPKAEPVRRYLSDHADLVGAVRLPSDAFPGHAGHNRHRLLAKARAGRQRPATTAG